MIPQKTVGNAKVFFLSYPHPPLPQPNVPDETCWYNRVLWLLTSLGFDMAIAASFLYWTLVFKGRCFFSLATVSTLTEREREGDIFT